MWKDELFWVKNAKEQKAFETINDTVGHPGVNFDKTMIKCNPVISFQKTKIVFLCVREFIMFVFSNNK